MKTFPIGRSRAGFFFFVPKKNASAGTRFFRLRERGGNANIVHSNVEFRGV